MKKSIVGVLALLVGMSVGGVAMADGNVQPATTTTQQQVSSSPDQHPMRYGFGIDFGIPAGIAAGFVLHPKVDWLSTQVSFTYLLAPGGRLSVQLDPFALTPRLPIGLFADFQGGFMANASIPSQSWGAGYDYFNVYGGLRLGTPNGFHWNFEVGPTYMHVATSNFQSAVPSTNGVSLANPVLNGWVAPTFTTGFQVVWP